jgi:hypothetical protein
MSLPVFTFRLDHGYDFGVRLRGPEFERENMLVGGLSGSRQTAAIFLGRLAEYQHTTKNMWLDTEGAHAIYVAGKRRSGKTFTLGVIVEGLISKSWMRQNGEDQAVLVLDTMNIFESMSYSVYEGTPEDSQLRKEAERWQLPNERVPLRIFYPGGTNPPKLKDARQLSIRASDMTGEDWAALFGCDTFSDPIGQLIADVYEKVAIEGYTTTSSGHVAPKPNYTIDDLSACLENGDHIARFESRTVEAVRRRLSSLRRLTIFSESGFDVRELFVRGTVSILLLRDLDTQLRGLIIGLIVKKIMEQRSLSDRYERLARIAAARLSTAKKSDVEGASAIEREKNEFEEMASRGLPRGWIIIDEAQNYMPARGIVASKEPLKRYVNEGRNLGLSIVVATQAPSGLDASIRRNVDVLIIHSISMRDDVEAVEGMINTSIPESVIIERERFDTRVLEQTARSLPAGYAIVSSDQLSRICVVKIRPRMTTHGGIEY